MLKPVEDRCALCLMTNKHKVIHFSQMVIVGSQMSFKSVKRTILLSLENFNQLLYSIIDNFINYYLILQSIIFKMNNFKKVVFFVKNNLLNNKEIYFFLFFTLVIYGIFYKNIFSYQFNFWNSDAAIKMFPMRVFIYEKLSNFDFQFWTERVFLGYPIYLDIENGALNPVNLISIFLFGPVWSLKFLHLISFLIGSLCIYFTVKRFYPLSNLFSTLISVLAFYFSFFHINHLIHMNIVLVSMLLPIHIYLVWKLIDTEKIKYLIYQILIFSYGILWGQPQISFFIILLIGIFHFQIIGNFIKSIKYLFLVSLATFSLTFFQLYPSFQIFLDSQRVGSDLKFSEFTNSTTILLNNIFPYTLGYYQNYVGYEVSGAFSFVETYNYLGVSLVFLLIFYLVFGSKDKNYKFVILTVYFYLFFTFLSNFFPFKLPIYNDFRYWTRGIFLISFTFIFCTNFLMSLKREVLKANYKHLINILIILSITLLFESKDYLNFLIQNQFVYLKKIEFVIWFVILFFTFLIVYLFLIKKLNTKYFSIILLFIVLFDLRYFADDFLPLRVSRYRSESNFKTDPTCEYKRCLLENQVYNGYEFLIFKTFSPFGYSQFIDKEYTVFFDEKFQTNIEQSPRSETIKPNYDLTLLQNLGFQKILLANGNSYTFPENNLWILQENSLGRFIKNDEGNYEFEIDAPEARVYNLNLKYSENFSLYINSRESKLIKRGNFSEIFLEKGKNNIKITYYPFDVVIGFTYGILMLFLLIVIVKVTKIKII